MDTNPWADAAKYLRGAIGSMVYARYHYNKKTAEDILAEIEELKKDTDARVEASLLDRKAYLLLNSILALESEVPILQKQIDSFDKMPDIVKSSAEWIMNHTLLTNRLDEYKRQAEEEKKQLEEAKQQLKDYEFARNRKKLDEELEDLKEAPIEEAPKMVDIEIPGAGSWKDDEPSPPDEGTPP